MYKKTIGGHCERCGDLINKMTGYEMLDRTSGTVVVEKLIKKSTSCSSASDVVLPSTSG